MNWAAFNWLNWGYVMWALTWGIFLFYAIRRRWTRLGLLIGIANMLLVSLNVVAPFRGALDPRYVGYNFFLISIPPGFGVTVAAGSILLLSLYCAVVAVDDRKGRPMLLLAGWNGVIALLVGLPLLYELLTDPGSFAIYLGEYVTIPSYLAFPVMLVLMVVPFALAVPWGLKRAK
jgi:hypothetical protein